MKPLELSKERFNAILNNAFAGQPLGANGAELREMVLRLSHICMEQRMRLQTPQNAAQMGQGVTTLTKEEVLLIGGTLASLQVKGATGELPDVGLLEDCNRSIKALKPKS